MDDTRFDAWTRRRFGLTTGGLLASLLGLTALPDAATAKRKKRNRKKCKNNQKRCGTKKCVKGDCCPGKPCGEDCECQRTIGGNTICIDLTFIMMCTQCNSNADCEAPLRCVKANCGGGGTAVCKRPCGSGP
ncbi:MAG: hypothetical protein ACRDJC_14145 [Thermomicrobiales bacterium]